MSCYIGARWDQDGSHLYKYPSRLVVVAEEPELVSWMIGGNDLHVYRVADSLQTAVLAKANPAAVKTYGPPAGCVRLTAREQDSIAVSLAAGMHLILKAAEEKRPDSLSNPAAADEAA